MIIFCNVFNVTLHLWTWVTTRDYPVITPLPLLPLPKKLNRTHPDDYPIPEVPYSKTFAIYFNNCLNMGLKYS
ncbi:hypothetical protein FKM82_016720 [Ascaphus truei]